MKIETKKLIILILFTLLFFNLFSGTTSLLEEIIVLFEKLDQYTNIDTLYVMVSNITYSLLGLFALLVCVITELIFCFFKKNKMVELMTFVSICVAILYSLIFYLSLSKLQVNNILHIVSILGIISATRVEVIMFFWLLVGILACAVINKFVLKSEEEN